MSTDGTLRSEISPSTPPELVLVPGEALALEWTFRNDAGQLVRLDSSDTLNSEYEGNLSPAVEVRLRVVNGTGAAIELEVVAHGKASVEPTGPQKIAAHADFVWRCRHSGGDDCRCASGGVACKCGTWSVRGAPQPPDVTIPDPTFKVRWQARTIPLSTP